MKKETAAYEARVLSNCIREGIGYAAFGDRPWEPKRRRYLTLGWHDAERPSTAPAQGESIPRFFTSKHV